MGDLPKLLVVTEWEPEAGGGGPAILRQMMRNYPPALVSWWSCLGSEGAGSYSGQLPLRWYPNKRLVEAKARFLEAFWVPTARRQLSDVIDRLKPEAIWHVPHKWAIPVAHSALLPKARQLHVTVQDYMDITANLPALGRRRAEAFAEMSDDLYRNAKTRDATSHAMVDDLRMRTGAAASQVIHAGLEEEDFDQLRQPVNSPSEILLAYAGTIQVEAAFRLFVQALNVVRHSLHQKVKLIFFSAHRYANSEWFDPTWMEDRGHLRLSQLHEELRKCSWGISLMALGDDARYNRYSFPTKFISYLAGGLPVLTLAHDQSSVYQMAAKYKVGVETSTTVREELAGLLRDALSDTEAKKRYQPAILRCAQAEFDADKMRMILRECFRRCAQAATG